MHIINTYVGLLSCICVIFEGAQPLNNQSITAWRWAWQQNLKQEYRHRTHMAFKSLSKMQFVCFFKMKCHKIINYWGHQCFFSVSWHDRHSVGAVLVLKLWHSTWCYTDYWCSKLLMTKRWALKSSILAWDCDPCSGFKMYLV